MAKKSKKTTKQVNIEEMDQKEIDQLSITLGEKVRHLCDIACEKANKVLNPFGMNARMQFLIEPIKKPSEINQNQ